MRVGDAQGRAAQPQLHQAPALGGAAAADEDCRAGENLGRAQAPAGRAEKGHPAAQGLHEGDPQRQPQPAEPGGDHRVQRDPGVGELPAAGAGDALGRHDLHAGRRPSGRHQALAGGERLPGLHHQRAHRERPRAQLAPGAGHAGDQADEPQILRELRGQTHPRQAGRGGDGLREPAHGRGHGAGAGARHDFRSRSGGDMRGVGLRVERRGLVEEMWGKNPAWDNGGVVELGFLFVAWRRYEKKSPRVFWSWDFGVVIFGHDVEIQKNPTRDSGGSLDLGFWGCDFCSQSGRHLRRIYLSMAGVSWSWDFGVVIFGQDVEIQKNPTRDSGGSLDLGFWGCDFYSCHGGDLREIHLRTAGVFWSWDFGVVIFGHDMEI